MNEDILLVDDDPNAIELLGRILSLWGNLRFATNGEDALRLVRDSAPDLILLDAQMPGMTGFQVCEALKADPTLADVPVIFVTSHSDAAFEVAGFEMGAVDFIVKPVSAPLVLARVRTQLRVKHMADELRRISTTDSLTSVGNRRQFDSSLEIEWRRATRSGEPLALLMIDVDHFKLYNDSYGHPAGDACLRAIAQALTSTSLRAADLVTRYGGEEFAVLLPQTSRAGAEHVTRDLLRAVEALDIAHETSVTAAHVTVSVGIACYDSASVRGPNSLVAAEAPGFLRQRCTPSALVSAADRALYAAKSLGRARAVLDTSDLEAPGRPHELKPLLDLAGPGADHCAVR